MTTHGALRTKPIRGVVSAAEWQARLDLAACCRPCAGHARSDPSCRD